MTMPKMPTSFGSATFEADMERYRADYEAWLQTPEGQAEAEAERKRAEEKARRLAEKEAHDARERLAGAGVPRRVRDILEAGAKDTAALLRVSKWQADRQPHDWCLVLSATKGAGKTVAAGWWMRENQAFRVRCWDKKRGDFFIPSWWTATGLCRVNAYGPEFEALCEHSGPIVIDDLGSEYNDKAGFLQTMVDSLMDARYSEYRPILITTNLNAQAFKERYSERVADRIREGGSFFEFRAESMRRAS